MIIIVTNKKQQKKLDWSLDRLFIEEKEAEHMLAGGWLGLAVGTIARQHNHGDQGLFRSSKENIIQKNNK